MSSIIFLCSFNTHTHTKNKTNETKREKRNTSDMKMFFSKIFFKGFLMENYSQFIIEEKKRLELFMRQMSFFEKEPCRTKGKRKEKGEKKQIWVFNLFHVDNFRERKENKINLFF